MERKYPPPLLDRLQTRLLAPITLGLLAVSLLGSVLIYQYIRQTTGKESRDVARSLMRIVRQEVRRNMLESHPERTQTLLRDMAAMPYVKGVYIVDTGGVVRFSSDPEKRGTRLDLKDPECGSCVNRLERTKTEILEFKRGRGAKSYLRTAAPIPNQAECHRCHAPTRPLRGVLVVDVPTGLQWSVLATLRRHVAVFILVGFFVLTAIIMLVTKRLVTGPVSRIIEDIRAVGAGDFTHPIDPRGNDEIALLGEAFDAMRSDLAKFVGDIKAKDTHIEELTALRQNLQAINRSLNRRIQELTLLNKVGAAVNANLELAGLFDAVRQSVVDTLEVDSFCLFLYNPVTEQLELKAGTGLQKTEESEVTFRRGEGIAGRVLETGRPRIISDVLQEPDFRPYKGMHPDARSLLVAPLVVKNAVTGVLHIMNHTPNAFSPYDLTFFTAVANQLAVAIVNAQLYEEQKSLAVTDSLTRLSNHGFFQRRLSEETARAHRYSRDLALMMLDIDHFKQVNDRHGHTAGDEVLRAIGKLLKAQSRATDTVARYGGEEFMVIMPETTLDSAKVAAERIRHAVEEMATAIPDLEDPLRLTISIGVSVFRPPEDTKSALIERADEALYQAKAQGRNQVVVALG